ncbi:MAG: hypothetical protein P1V97_37210 [Planctomycetota bacterium]|nr:hypothetical protein [Planctomycetota bacterium]
MKTSSFEWGLRIGVPLIAFFFACFTMNADIVGSFQDDALYLDMARSLGQGTAFVSESLPGQPSLGKYPVFHPLLLSSFYLFGEPSITALLLFQSLIFASFLALLINVILPLLKLKAPERLAIFAVLVSHDIFLQAMFSLLSESLFCLLLCAQFCSLIQLLKKSEPNQNWTWPALFTVVSFLACLTRSVSLVLLPFLILYLLYRKYKKTSVLVGLALVLSIGIQSGLRQKLSADNQERHPHLKTALAYYLDYSFHTGYYKDPLKEGDVSVVAGRVAETVASNSYYGARSLGSLFNPMRIIRLALGYKNQSQGGLSIFLGLFFLGAAFFGLYQDSSSRLLFLFLLPYIALFIGWTWVFSARFWLPVLPFLLLGVAQSARKLGRIPRLLIPIVLVVFLIPHVFFVFSKEADPDLSGRDPQTFSEGEREYDAFEKQLAWLSQYSSRERGDVFFGGFNSFWVARRLDLPGLWLASLAPRDSFIRKGLNLAPELGRTEENGEKAWGHLQMIQETLPENGRIFVQVDFSTSPEGRLWVRDWHKRGRLVLLTGSPFTRLYKVKKQKH